MTAQDNIALCVHLQKRAADPHPWIGPMNILSRDQQIAVISALTEGMSIRATERLTGIHRDTIMRLAARVGQGCTELHDRRMVGVRTGRLELDELWAFVAKKQKRVKRHEAFAKGDQYTFVALAATSRAIVSYRTGKRDGDQTDQFIQDLRGRVLGAPEISTDGWHPYKLSIRDAFRNSAHGVIVKTLAVTDLRKDAAHRYSPCEVVAVAREVVQGVPAEISTSYVERSNLSVRMASRRFTRLTNGFSKKLDNHVAAVSLYVAHYNWCRPHESLGDMRHQTTPAMALGLADHVWSIGKLIDAALIVAPPQPTETAPDRRRRFRVIQGGKA
jgi:IS1 family transposase